MLPQVFLRDCVEDGYGFVVYRAEVSCMFDQSPVVTKGWFCERYRAMGCSCVVCHLGIQAGGSEDGKGYQIYREVATAHIEDDDVEVGWAFSDLGKRRGFLIIFCCLCGSGGTFLRSSWI
ncbi:hypothetical protein GIB67_014978 [Kingdonia uniflora]|uniref:Uncharacterized protein n=1 Tax=Kingdonia uniflora TaxID=39325 RepID=A0A7J7MTL6_9MAGN|nr:hypothetical protein GIB67_014978 [Kingdonia uniflora]